jgi:hypothetical protein
MSVDTTSTPNLCTPDRVAALDAAMASVRAEVLRAIAKFPPFNSGHEGYAVLKEEVDELWDDVKRDYPEGALQEAVQVAAMGVRFLMNVKVKR